MQASKHFAHLDQLKMVKRYAEDTLDDSMYADSPVNKKPKLAYHDKTAAYDQTNPQSSHGPSNAEEQRVPNNAAPEVQPSPHEPRNEVARDEVDVDGDEDEESAFSAPSRQTVPLEGYTDLYLDTIDRSVLDFDFEKLCSITLSNINVYACLICGKYFQGRGTSTHAYFHALEDGHHVYVNMQTKKVYVLPEGYEVMNKSLEDIKFVVDPRLSKEELNRMDREPRDAWDLGGKIYRPGFVGMNNIKENDYFNVIIQALVHIPPLRNFLVLEDLSSKPELVQRFSILARKIWNTRAFKSHVSPHELLQQVSRQSDKRFELQRQSDPVDFLRWFLDNLHLSLGGTRTKPKSTKKPISSTIQRFFQGRLKQESQHITAKSDASDRLRFEEAAEVAVETTTYQILTLDLPDTPLFQDELDNNIIPQV